jgi:phenylacetate-CoA ligase
LTEKKVILDRKEDGRDYMTLKVERDEGVEKGQDQDLSRRIGEEIKKQIMVSASIELVDYGSLPRSERKSKRVFDNRESVE